LKDDTFLELVPKYKDISVVVGWIDICHKALKTTGNPSKPVYVQYAKELGVDTTGSRKKLIKGIMGTDTYELFFISSIHSTDKSKCPLLNPQSVTKRAAEAIASKSEAKKRKNEILSAPSIQRYILAI
jgi:hypothetical protein